MLRRRKRLNTLQSKLVRRIADIEAANHSRLGRTQVAKLAFEKALSLAKPEPEQRFLRQNIDLQESR